jgi:hypothetical protein
MNTIIDTTPGNKYYVVEKHWTTKAGLLAVVIMGSLNHRCGYVAVESTSKLFGASYHDQIPEITKDMADNTTLGNKPAILLLCASAGADDDNSVRRSLDIVINVHRCLTYSSESVGSSYPVKTSEPAWWFGYDCGHYGDNEPGGQSLEYCIAECESLATQLAAF